MKIKKADIQAIEKGLEQLRSEEITHGTAIHDAPNEALFVIDSQGSQNLKQIAKKQLWVDRALEPLSRVPAVHSRTNLSKTAQGIVSKKGQSTSTARLVKKMAAKLAQKPDSVKKIEPKSNLWDQQTVKAKKQLKKPAVIIEHAGSSYNPRYQDHQEILGKVVGAEQAKINELKAAEEKLSYPKELDQLDDDDFFASSSEEEPEEEDTPAIVKEQPKRKTDAQRRKEKRKLTKPQKEPLIKEPKLKKIKSKTRQSRLGPYKFQPERSAVALSEELGGSLRTIKTDLNLFKDRFKSLEQRGIIETRVPFKRRRRYQQKVVEVHSYKRFQ